MATLNISWLWNCLDLIWCKLWFLWQFSNQIIIEKYFLFKWNVYRSWDNTDLCQRWCQNFKLLWLFHPYLPTFDHFEQAFSPLFAHFRNYVIFRAKITYLIFKNLSLKLKISKKRKIRIHSKREENQKL